MDTKLSSHRQKLMALQKESEKLTHIFLAGEWFLPGCVYTLQRRCGKQTCRCAKGKLHSTEVLSYRGEGRPKNITPRPGELADFKKLTESYQRFRQTRAQLVKLHLEMLQVVDEIEAMCIEKGEKRFRKIQAKRNKQTGLSGAAKR